MGGHGGTYSDTHMNTKQNRRKTNTTNSPNKTTKTISATHQQWSKAKEYIFKCKPENRTNIKSEKPYRTSKQQSKQQNNKMPRKENNSIIVLKKLSKQEKQREKRRQSRNRSCKHQNNHQQHVPCTKTNPARKQTQPKWQHKTMVKKNSDIIFVLKKINRAKKTTRKKRSAQEQQTWTTFAPRAIFVGLQHKVYAFVLRPQRETRQNEPNSTDPKNRKTHPGVCSPG